MLAQDVCEQMEGGHFSAGHWRDSRPDCPIAGHFQVCRDFPMPSVVSPWHPGPVCEQSWDGPASPPAGSSGIAGTQTLVLASGLIRTFSTARDRDAIKLV